MSVGLQAKANGTQGAVQLNGSNSLVFDATGIDSSATVTATVSSNAITVTLNPCGLRFRSATPSNGTPTYLETTSAITLTIAATDSFGLITAAGNQRIAIIAINNAGVMELAATALWGGVALDETGVITTAATATTATAIKGLGVRTGVPYRVVGIIDSTFTTAVGWGSLALVHSIGGQALASSMAAGFGQTWTSYAVPSGRNVGVTYYNNTGRPITLSIVNIAANTYNILINGSAAAITPYGGYGNTVIQIPVGASYQVANGTINLWAELR